ncbi:hypothetical protein BY996DRAFT_6487777 [Phakopsora pachyrhizi]|nr:hypothetical protein BY996DRAFT_6487777 [Phakopsora pachyrhizi]
MLLTSEPSVIIDSYTNIPTRSTTADDQDRYPVPIDQQILQNSTTTTPSSASTDRLNGSTTDLIEQLWLTIRCLDDTVQLAQADDPIYSQLSLPISSIDGPELWSEIENTIDGLFDPDQGNGLIIRRGENGLERLISYIQLARQHPAWNGHDKLLEPKLNRLLKSVIQAGHKCFPRSESLIDQADNTVVNDLPQTEPEDGQSNINREDNIDMDNVPRRRPVDRIIDEMEIDSNPNSATVAHKLEVIDYHNRTGATQKQTANRFGLTQSQLSRWLKEEDELREYVMDKGSSSKRQRTGDFPQIEETLLRFFIESKSRNIAPSDDTLKQHTKAFMKLYGVSENALKKLKAVTGSFALEDIYVAGEKHQLHVIGQTQDSNVWQPKSEEKSFLYRYTTCGSITGPVFAEWIKKFDREMQRRKRKQFLSLEGEEDQKGRETMPSDEEIVNEAKFHSDQCREEAKKRKMDELEENNKSNNNKAKQNKGKIKKTTTVGPERQLNFNFTNNEGLLEMIPLSIQGMISSLENLEYSMPIYKEFEAGVKRSFD